MVPPKYDHSFDFDFSPDFDENYQSNSSRFGRGFAKTWGTGFNVVSSFPTQIQRSRNDVALGAYRSQNKQQVGNDGAWRQKNAYRSYNDNNNKRGNRTQWRQNNNYIPANPELKAILKPMFTLIRMVHHLNNITTKENKDPPKAFQNLEKLLMDTIKPASPNDRVQELLMGNAKNWMYTTRLILEEHYEFKIQETLGELMSVIEDDWHKPFEIAKGWATRRMGQRLRRETIIKAETLVQEAMNVTSEIVGNSKATRDEKKYREAQTSYDEDFPPLPTPRGPSVFPIQSTAKPQRSQTRNNPCVVLDPIVTIETLPSADQQEADLENTKQNTKGHNESTEQSHIDDLLLLTVDSDSDSPSPYQGLLASPVRAENAQNDTQIQTPVHTLLQYSPTLTPPTQSSTPTRKPTRHINTKKKLIDWGLMVRKKWLVIGDSNLSRIPPFQIADLQVDSYPGATFLHAEAIIKKAKVNTQVEKVVLSFGINNRTQKFKETAIKQLQRAVKASKDKFPDAMIWVPLINFSTSLPVDQQRTLDKLNTYIHKHMRYIPLLPTADFQVERDATHWTPTTGKAMLRHWATHLNCTAP